MDSTIASYVFSTIDIMCGLVRWISANLVFVAQESVEKRPSTSIMVSSMAPGYLCVVEKVLIESTSSDTSRSGEIRLVLQTELVVKRGIQSVGGSFSSSNGPILQARV